MHRVKTKLPDDLDSDLRGLANLRKVCLHDYCRQVVDVFIHGALATARRAGQDIPFVSMDSLSSKCVNDLDLMLQDEADFDTAGGVHALAVINNITASEVLRNILAIHVHGANHLVSMRLHSLPEQGNKRGGK